MGNDIYVVELLESGLQSELSNLDSLWTEASAEGIMPPMFDSASVDHNS